jgi:nucleotide-binding universal stress UspA family protein
MAEVILCAVDDSEAASRVFDAARGLADALGGELVAVHVVASADKDADEIAASVRSRLGGTGVAPDVRLVVGSPAEALMETADREGAELLVVGSRGRGSLRSAVLGSVSRELAARAPCPVVVVPSASRQKRQVGVKTLTRAWCAELTARTKRWPRSRSPAGWRPRLGSRLVLVHARQNLRAVAAYPGARSTTPPVTGQEDSVQGLVDKVIEDAAQAAGVSSVGVVEPGPPAEVLETVADREDARLIVIAARGVGSLRAALLGSVAADLPAEASRPVVVVSPAAAVAQSGP